MKQLKEQFKPIKNYEGLYLISNFGYVVSLPKTWEGGCGMVRKKIETVLKPIPNRQGYFHVNLYKNSSRKSHRIHHLVFDAFGEGKRKSKRNGAILMCDHIDNNKQNNRIDNLQLLTNRENCSKYHKTQKSSSRFIGVYWNKQKDKWHSVIQINGKLTHLGFFQNEINASKAYDLALKEYNDTGTVTVVTPHTMRKTSQYVGVHWFKRTKKWRSHIQKNGKYKHLGYFTNEKDAADAYQKALKEIICKKFETFYI